QGEIDRIRIFDATLKPILVSNPIQIGEEVPQQALREAMADKHTVQFFQERGGQRVLFTLVPLRGPRRTVRGVMEILRSAGDIDARIAAARREIVLRVGLLVIIMAALTWVGVRQTVVVPIRRLMVGVNALAAGRPILLPARGRNEIARLARAFNDMAERLADARQRLVAETEARLDLARHVRQTEQLAVAGRIASGVAHE